MMSSSKPASSARNYVTKVIKHFQMEPRGKRRIHKNSMPARLPLAVPGGKPRLIWLPEVIVCLGATAAQALLVQNSESANNAGNSLIQLWRLTSWPQFIRLQFFMPRMMKLLCGKAVIH